MTSLERHFFASVTLVLVCLAPAVVASQPIGSMQEPVAPPAGLFFKTEDPDLIFEAEGVTSNMAVEIDGIVVRGHLTQEFRNPSAAWLEGIYVFPLPDDAAVDRMTILVGTRQIVGHIMEREEAQRAYEAAAAEGKRAGLLASERPNVFMTSIANIAPRETVRVSIEFQATVNYADGRFSLRLPSVVAPRFGPPLNSSGTHSVGLAPAERSDPFGSFRDPAGGVKNRQSFQIDLDAGFELAEVSSLYHEIRVTGEGERQQLITLVDSNAPADRDFVLEWRPSRGAKPQSALFIEEVAGATYLLGLVIPPQSTQAENATAARDLVFVIDTSGSMHGPSIDQARLALLRAIHGLRPGDRFNVIQFNSTTSSLFRRVQPVTPESLEFAARYIRGLKADGGTEMRPALDLALSEGAPDARLRQVVFITDGAISYEEEFFQALAGKLGATRLFTVGIGSAPNQYFMRQAAELGRGSAVFVGDTGETEARVSELLAKLDSPTIIDLNLSAPRELSTESYPARLPDIYAGDPAIFAVRLTGSGDTDLTGILRITGKTRVGNWIDEIPLQRATSAKGVAKIWARQKFDEIVNLGYGNAHPALLRKEATQVALQHELVTRYTSLVAIDDEPVRPPQQPLVTAEMPRDLPAGWSDEKVFGARSKRELLQDSGLRPIRLDLDDAAALQLRQISLPQTASDAPLKLLVGLLLLSLACLALKLRNLRFPARLRVRTRAHG